MSSERCKGRIALFFALGTYDTVSSVRDGVNLLAHAGYLVEVYLLENSLYPVASADSEGVTIIGDKPFAFFHGSLPPPKWMRGRGGRPYKRFAFDIVGPAWRRLVFKRELLKRHLVIPYQYMIGIDPEGLPSAAQFANWLGIPYIFWSLELRFMDQANEKSELKLKRQEIELSRGAALSIVQDEWRKEALVKENGLDGSRVLFVPNAPMGTARRIKSSFLREKLNIPAEKKIILCSGTIATWGMCRELVEAASDLPDDVVLVMHSRLKRDPPLRGYENSVIAAADPKRVIFSFDSVPSAQYPDLVRSADVGVAFYNGVSNSGKPDKNMVLMGYSSGKISDYLQNGIPIVVNECIGPRQLVDTYGCGVWLSNPQNFSKGVRAVFDDFERYSANALRCFDTCLELEKHFQAVITFLDNRRMARVP